MESSRRTRNHRFLPSPSALVESFGGVPQESGLQSQFYTVLGLYLFNRAGSMGYLDGDRGDIIRGLGFLGGAVQGGSSVGVEVGSVLRREDGRTTAVLAGIGDVSGVSGETVQVAGNVAGDAAAGVGRPVDGLSSFVGCDKSAVGEAQSLGGGIGRVVEKATGGAGLSGDGTVLRGRCDAAGFLSQRRVSVVQVACDSGAAGSVISDAAGRKCESWRVSERSRSVAVGVDTGGAAAQPSITSCDREEAVLSDGTKTSSGPRFARDVGVSVAGDGGSVQGRVGGAVSPVVVSSQVYGEGKPRGFYSHLSAEKVAALANSRADMFIVSNRQKEMEAAAAVKKLEGELRSVKTGGGKDQCSRVQFTTDATNSVKSCSTLSVSSSEFGDQVFPPATMISSASVAKMRSQFKGEVPEDLRLSKVPGTSPEVTLMRFGLLGPADIEMLRCKYKSVLTKSHVLASGFPMKLSTDMRFLVTRDPLF